MLSRTTRSIAITSGILLLFVLIASLAACSVAPAPTPTIEQKPAITQPSAFKVASLTVSPANANRGEAVSIIANVTNTGASEGTYKAELGINKVTEVSKALTIPAGATQTLNFVVSRAQSGSYEVTLGGLTGNFTVADQAKIVQTSTTNNSNSSPNAAVPSCCGTSQTSQTTTSNVPNCCAPATTPNAPTSSYTPTPARSGGCCGR